LHDRHWLHRREGGLRERRQERLRQGAAAAVHQRHEGGVPRLRQEDRQGINFTKLRFGRPIFRIKFLALYNFYNLIHQLHFI
jgi:hypothetical protein